MPGASPSHTFLLSSSYILPLLSLGCWVAWGPPHAPLWSVRRQPPHLAGTKFVLVLNLGCGIFGSGVQGPER